MAKLLARAVNCENPQDGEPCNECHSCRAILEQRSMNVLEIDAASNTGVDNIREIREEIQYPPAEGKYKIYIIDEVHMLSTGAFNAMLKTLEEPPDHVVFILATTDPQKIPVTVHSRCQRFDFKRVSASEMLAAISGYVESENFDISGDALKYIISIADGSMRDALTLLERCVSFYEGSVTVEDVLEITGSVDKRVCFDLTGALVERDSSSCIDIIEKINRDGRDFYQFTTDMITHFRNLLVSLSVHGGGSAALDYSAENVKMLSEQAQTAGRDRLLSLMAEFSKLQADMKYSDTERILLEVCCIKICSTQSPAAQTAPQPSAVPTVRTEITDSTLLARLEKLERGLADAKLHGLQPAKDKPAKPPVHKVIAPSNIDWPGFIKKHGRNELCYLQKSELSLVDGVLYLICDNIVSTNVLKKKEDEIKSLLISDQGDPGVITFIDRREYNRKFGVSEQSDDDADFESLRKSMGL